MTVGGITVPLSHPDKVLFPGDGITKEELARYAKEGGAVEHGVCDKPAALVPGRASMPAGMGLARRRTASPS